MKTFKSYPGKAERAPEVNEVQIFKYLFREYNQIFDENSHFRLIVEIIGIMLNEDLFKENAARLIQQRMEDFLIKITERLPSHRTFSYLLNFKTINSLVLLFSTIWRCCQFALDTFLRS